ncbi:hypothetical protein [Arthrobacter sp. StoSoilB22]|uniref:hypothetical protein n=1 Tax=Arthrobacter sp. StoSoilB22 TaxID=2830996 RepID=UPI0025704E6D|nr:hypothetical protein [Arthrobacter sp. StoSoilB22]
MSAIVRAWDARANVPQAVAHLVWGHIRSIFDEATTADERDCYAAAAVSADGRGTPC